LSDAKAALRRYLEQRRDLGESEFVLDGMSVEEALRTLGAIRTGALKHAPRRRSDEMAEAMPAAAPVVQTPQDEGPEPDLVEEPMDGPPPPIVKAPSPGVHAGTGHEAEAMKKLQDGLVVGAADGSLFESNPFSRVRTLDGIAKLVHECTRCPLYKTATHGVPGEGNPQAELVCVGEAPGANEDATGRPFVGAAGQLLTKILGAINMTREDVFICNVLKHRPPGNRNPMPKEVEACSPYLVRQIEIIKPKVILAFGTFAAQTLLETKTPIGKLRGMVHRYHGVPLIVTYHPAALLRNPAWKRPTWEDVKLARRLLDNAG